MEDNIIKQSLNNIFEEFAKDDEMFLSEADLQFELASKLKEKNVKNLIVEYPISSDKLYDKYKGKDKPKTSNKHIDLFFKYNDEDYFVELKYKLKRQINKIKRKGKTFELPGHGAVPVNKYAVYLDIERMEQIKKIKKCKSFVLFITNDNYKDKSSDAAENFPLNKETKMGTLKYNGKSDNEKRDLYLEKSYDLNWEPIKGDFKYLLIDLNEEEDNK